MNTHFQYTFSGSYETSELTLNQRSSYGSDYNLGDVYLGFS